MMIELVFEYGFVPLRLVDLHSAHPKIMGGGGGFGKLYIGGLLLASDPDLQV